MAVPVGRGLTAVWLRPCGFRAGGHGHSGGIAIIPPIRNL